MTTPFVMSDEERTTGNLLIRSSLWEQPDGTFDWHVWHPPSGWEARGNGETVESSYAHINKCLQDVIEAEGLGRIEEQVLVVAGYDDARDRWPTQDF